MTREGRVVAAELSALAQDERMPGTPELGARA